MENVDFRTPINWTLKSAILADFKSVPNLRRNKNIQQNRGRYDLFPLENY